MQILFNYIMNTLTFWSGFYNNILKISPIGFEKIGVFFFVKTSKYILFCKLPYIWETTKHLQNIVGFRAFLLYNR